MPGISRNQIVVYAVIAAVLLLVGANSLRSGSDEPATSFPASASGAGDSSDSGGDSGTDDGGFTTTSNAELLVVDVSGGVARPGVYELKQGSRVIDAIKVAGGLLRKAVPGAINRAAMLADGQQVVVPMIAAGGGGAVGGIGGAAVAAAELPDAPVSLGTATPEQLEEIDGIGPVTAQKIIEFRDSNGGVGSIDDLDQVSGIGPVTMEALRSGLQP